MGIETFVRDFQRDAKRLEYDYGVVFMDGTRAYLPPEAKRNFGGAMDALIALDAQPALTAVANAGIPAMLTSFIDPDIFHVLFAPNKAAKIMGGGDGGGEKKKGDWTDMIAFFPIVEAVGEVSSYGDFNNNAMSGLNMAFPQRQSYHYETIVRYGEREIAMAGRARVDLASEKKNSATIVLDKFQTFTYFYGVAGLQNYGLINDPALPAPIQPGAKAFNVQAHGPWITGGVVTATPNEVYSDFLALFAQLVTQTQGIVELDSDTKMVLVMSPQSMTALASANSFNVNVFDLLKKQFPNLRIETAVQYATPAGNLVQLIADDLDGQDTGYVAFTEKLRAHPLIQMLSAYEQKMSQGTWGAIIRQPFAFAQMLGV